METEHVSIAGLDLTVEQRKAVGFLAEFTKRMVLMAFAEGMLAGNSSNLIKEIYQVTDDILTGCLKSGMEPHCRKGCFWCCYLRVKATPLEVIGIVEYLRAYLDPEGLSELRKHLAATDEVTRGMDGAQRVGAKATCPLLVDGACLAYPVRPITCRVYHSLKVSDCEANLENVGGNVMIRHDISGLSMGLFAGLTEGLRKIGLQPRLVELIAGLRIAMDETGVRKGKRLVCR